MSEKTCEACLYLGKSRPANIQDSLYTKQAFEVRISLCNVHSIELYKSGQNNFILKYDLENKREERKVPNL